MKPLLTLERVALSYPRTKTNKTELDWILQDLCLCLEKGELACLLGASGSGKSSLLRAIAGFEPLQQGRIVLDGRVLNQDKQSVAAHQRQIGLMFQDYALFSHLNVAANIGFGIVHWPVTERAQRIQTLLDLIGLRARAHAFAEQLSGGEQQRVALARALAPRPKLLLLDEPFSNLDSAIREPLALQVRTILKTEGVAALLVTHDQLESFALADRVGVLHARSIAQWDTPEGLYQQPKTRFIAEFVGFGNFLPATLIDRQTVHTELGTFPVTLMQTGIPPTPVAAQSITSNPASIQVLLRPQAVTLDPSSPYRAKLLARTFRGADYHYHLRLSSGYKILVRIPAQQAPCKEDASENYTLGVRVTAPRLIAFAS